jgi:hypothetical protein
VPAACQNEAETRDIEQYPDGQQTYPDQGNGRRPPTVKRPCKRQVSGSIPLTGSCSGALSADPLASRGAVARVEDKIRFGADSQVDDRNVVISPLNPAATAPSATCCPAR